mmetsp:Transcript_9037/g.21569  ORF Transcript_9037/g.21569 Transcript_9037/m.21569 type:complete len:331 (-) Transcript_9037:213-1205(-)
MAARRIQKTVRPATRAFSHDSVVNAAFAQNSQEIQQFAPPAPVQFATTLFTSPQVMSALQMGATMTNDILRTLTIPVRLQGPEDLMNQGVLPPTEYTPRDMVQNDTRHGHETEQNFFAETSHEVNGTEEQPTASTSNAGIPDLFQVKHDFAQRAAQNQLGRALHQRHEVEGTLPAAFEAVSDFPAYAEWMPWCDFGRNVGDISKPNYNCVVGFGIEAPVVGRLGDQVHYDVMVHRPDATREYARCVATTTPAGFAYGDVLIYDWKFAKHPTKPDTHVNVVLDVYFQAKSWYYMPVWDSLENKVIADMVKAFKKRIIYLSADGCPPGMVPA